ncbi:MAG TPA: DoxX family protein [Alphaproteobacteria bacterium]|nr:DoxX family protein [Alphaproteobacteria bacterium]
MLATATATTARAAVPIGADGVDRSLAPYALFGLRLALAAMWASHGLLKFLVFTLPGTAQFFASVGLPPMLAYIVAPAELLGAAAILLGWHGRLASLLLTPVLLGAAFVHWPNGWVFTAAGGGWEYPVFLAAMGLVHALAGEGAFALRPAAGRAAA